MPASTKEETPKGKIQFFGEIDLNDKTGGIRSDMPAWYFDVHISELEEGIARQKRQLESGAIDGDQVPRIKNEIAAGEARLKQITSGKPKLEGTQKDRVFRVYESLQKQIKDTMPTHRENERGLVSPHEELKRQKSKHIKVDTEIAKACGVKSVHGKISGDEANKCYKILGKALGEPTNIERLRRDGNSEAYQSMHDLTNAILQGREVGRLE